MPDVILLGDINAWSSTRFRNVLLVIPAPATPGVEEKEQKHGR